MSDAFVESLVTCSASPATVGLGAITCKACVDESQEYNNKIEIDAGMVTLRQPLGHERNGYTEQLLLVSKFSLSMGEKNSCDVTFTRAASAVPYC